jgi:predicted acyl esterase
MKHWTRAILVFGLCFTGFSKEMVMLPMRDGIKLATDLYIPTNSASFPVIFGRTPYNKDNLFTVGTDAVKHGYVFVGQDARGRFASQGENMPFATDMNDGADTLKWISAQPWCNGQIGTWGASAGAINQFQSIIAAPERINSQFLIVGAPKLYDVIYLNGIFRKSLIEDWLKQNRWSSNALSVWLSHPLYDDYWKERDATRNYKKVIAPSVSVGGYWDIFAQKTIDGFIGYQTQPDNKSVRTKQHLIIGPWTHAVLTDRAGDLVFRNAKNPPGDLDDAWKWFDYSLRGITNGLEKTPAILYYVIGDTQETNAPGNFWRTADSWPPFPKVKPKELYLTADLKLSDSVQKAPKPLMYTYHPETPAPTVGGIQLTIPAGPKDQQDLERRADVFSFEGEVLTEPKEVTGRVKVKLWVSSDAPDTDFFATLCDVYPDGRTYNICEGSYRMRYREGTTKEVMMKPGKIYPIEIDLWSTSIIFNKGHKIRVHVTSSSSPGYDINPNTGESIRYSTNMQNAHNSIYVDGQHPSHLLLPVITTH